MNSFTAVGKRIPKLDAAEKVTGRSRYIQDLQLPGMLYGKILRTDRVHARIAGIDTSAARALPGVAAVLTAAVVTLPPVARGRPETLLTAEERYGRQRYEQADHESSHVFTPCARETTEWQTA